MSGSIVIGDLAGNEIVLDFEGQSISLGFFAGASQGESNNAANVGGGAGVYRDKTGAIINLRSLTGSGGVTVTENADTVDIGSSGDVAGPASSTNNAAAVFDGTSGKAIKEPDADVDYLGQGIANVGNVDGRDVSADGATLDATSASLGSHIADLNNPHQTGIDNLDSGTLAQLNAAVTDATIDGIGDPRDPNAHAISHQNGGSDEVNVNGLSGTLADPQTPATHATTHQNGGADEVDVTGLSGVLSDPQTPAAHVTTHQNGGADELNVGGLSGTLADPQTPAGHASTHEDGGADEINVSNLSGLLANPQTPLTHAATHSDGGSDEIDAADLGSGAATAGFVLAADGLGGNSYVSPSAADDAVAVTGADTTPGNLEAKINPGDGLTRTVLNPGANEQYQLDVALTADAQHGARGGGTQHAAAIASGASGFMTGADKAKLDGLITNAAPETRQIIAGAGMTGGGDLTADRTLNVIANADGSIAVAADNVGVGVLATDAQHGVRGGGTQHALAVASGAAGFLSGADKAKLDAVPADPGDVDGPASSTDNAVAVFDGVTGKTIKEPNAAVGFNGRDITNVGDVDGRDVQADGIAQDAHISSMANPHATDIGNLGNGTLAELNAKVTDATLDDSSSARPPTAHASTHSDGGSDEITIEALATSGGAGTVPTSNGLGGLTMQAATTLPAADTTSLVKGSVDPTKEVRIEADGLTTGTTRVLTMPDANITPDDASASRNPLAHAATHQNGGSDEISVSGLSGLLADQQTPLSHASTHSPGGSDALTTAAPSQGIGGGNTEGVATSFARSDHDHTIRETGDPTNLTVGSVANGQKLQRVGSSIVGVTDVFGENYQFASSDSRSTTTSATPQVKTTLTTPALTGTYLVEWHATLDAGNKPVKFDCYNSTDAVTLGFAQLVPELSTDRVPVGGIAQVVFTGSAKTLQLRWYNIAGKSDTVGISEARLMLRRVS